MQNKPITFIYLAIALLAFTPDIYAQRPTPRGRKSAVLEGTQYELDKLAGKSESRLKEINKKLGNVKKEETKVNKQEKIKEKVDPGKQYVKYEKRPTVDRIDVEYLETGTEDLYPAEEKGPAIVTPLNIYHMKHKEKRVPYTKDREGLKVLPWVGVRWEHMYDMEVVSIQSLIIEAKEFDQSSDSQLRDYISTNNKQYTQGEVLVIYKETWPKFTYTYYTDRNRRKYEAKHLWSANDIYYDYYDKDYYKLEYTIPGLPWIGYLKLTARYGDVRNHKPNDDPGLKTYDSWLIGLQCMSFFDTKLKAELLYQDGKMPHYANVDRWDEYELDLELEKLFPRYYLKIIPYYWSKKEEFFPVKDNDEWIEHHVGIRIEKEINGKLEFKTDWTYINYARDKQRDTKNYEHISVNALDVKNEIKYEIVRDVKFGLGLDYSTGFDFNGFDNVTLSSELSIRMPGLADYRIGYRHTEYYNINDRVDTFYFKIGLFI